MFFIGLKILLDFTNASSWLSCFLMKNQECKTRPQTVNANRNNSIFYPLVLTQVNVVAIILILIIHMHKFVFLIL